MATTAVLRPHDCLIGPNNTRLSRNRNPNPSSCPRRRKRSPTKSPAKPLVAGQVKILKRGEFLPPPPPSPPSAAEDLGICSAEPLGPPPKTVAEQIVVYAGSAMFVASPPPSSVPFPAFFAAREKDNAAATCDIRRLLGLDLDSIRW